MASQLTLARPELHPGLPGYGTTCRLECRLSFQEAPGLGVSYSFLKFRDVNLIKNLHLFPHLFPLPEMPSFPTLPNTFLYPKPRLKNGTDSRRQQLIQVKSQEKDEGTKTDDCRVTWGFQPQGRTETGKVSQLNLAVCWGCSLLPTCS